MDLPDIGGVPTHPVKRGGEPAQFGGSPTNEPQTNESSTDQPSTGKTTIGAATGAATGT